MGCGASSEARAAVIEPVHQSHRPAPVVVEESPRWHKVEPEHESAKTHGSQASADGELKEVTFAEVTHLHKEFESVSAPMATLTLQNLTKFQTRILRKHGDKLMKHLQASNPIRSLGKRGSSDKDLRDQAKKTSVLVFRKLGYWDEELKEPYPEKTVTFDEWLAVVYKCKVSYGAGGAQGSGAYTPSLVKLQGSVLKRNGKFSGSSLSVQTTESTPRTPGSSSLTPQVGGSSSPRIDEANQDESRVRLIKYPDNPTEEELESEWQLFLENENLKSKHHDHADEGAAFKQIKAVVKETGAETHLHPEEEEEHAPSHGSAGAPLPATESGHGSPAVIENGSGQSAKGGELVEEAATSSAQADSVSGDGVRDDCAGAEDAREGGGGATVQMESHQDGQAVTEDAAGKGEDIEGQVATANHGQPGPDVSDAAGAEDAGVPQGHETKEGVGVLGTAKRKGLVYEYVYHLTDEEVEHKALAIKDIRVQSHKHKHAVAKQSARGTSSASKPATSQSPKWKTAAKTVAAVMSVASATRTPSSQHSTNSVDQ